MELLRRQKAQEADERRGVEVAEVLRQIGVGVGLRIERQLLGADGLGRLVPAVVEVAQDLGEQHRDEIVAQPPRRSPSPPPPRPRSSTAATRTGASSARASSARPTRARERARAAPSCTPPAPRGAVMSRPTSCTMNSGRCTPRRPMRVGPRGRAHRRHRVVRAHVAERQRADLAREVAVPLVGRDHECVLTYLLFEAATGTP